MIYGYPVQASLAVRGYACMANQKLPEWRTNDNYRRQPGTRSLHGDFFHPANTVARLARLYDESPMPC